jgi:hypothetical protein
MYNFSPQDEEQLAVEADFTRPAQASGIPG